MTQPIKLSFTRDKETKNTVRFNEDERPGQPKLVQNVYIAKHIARDWTKCTVTLEAAQ